MSQAGHDRRRENAGAKASAEKGNDACLGGSALTSPDLDDHVASGLHRLKAEMAAAHPDRGGTTEAFIEARHRYLEAKRIAGIRRST